MINIAETFEKYADEYIKFDRVEDPAHSRPDICAFIVLDRLSPGAGCDMVCAAEHDMIYLNVNCKTLASVATDADLLLLRRCGVLYDDDTDSLMMFV